jgi:hypothetical protein
MIKYNQSWLLLLEPGLGSSSLSSKCTSVYLSPLKLLLWEMDWVLMEEKQKMRNSEAILTTRLQMLEERRVCEMGRVSLFLCLDME